MSQATELLPVLKVKRAQARTARMEAELERKKKHLQAMQEQLEWQERLQAAENDADRRTADAKVAIQIIEKQEREVIKELKRGSTAQSEVVESSKRRKTGRQDSEDSPTIRIEDGADWEEEKSPMQNRDHVYGGIVRLDGDIQTLSAEVEVSLSLPPTYEATIIDALLAIGLIIHSETKGFIRTRVRS